MKNTYPAVVALARFGNPENTSPKISLSKIDYVNELGQGLSDALIKANKTGFPGVILGLLSSPEAYASKMKPVILNVASRNSAKMLEIESYIKVFVAKKSAIVGALTGNDQKLVEELISAMAAGDKFAKAAVWFPMIYYWCRLTDKDSYLVHRILQDLLEEFVPPKYPNVETLDSLEDSNLLVHLDLSSYLSSAYDHFAGQAYERHVVGYSGKPTANEVSSIPLEERIREWVAIKGKYESGRKLAIQKVLEFRNVATEKNGYFRLSNDFIRAHPEWALNFINSCRELPGLDGLLDFAKNTKVWDRNFHRFDGESLIDFVVALQTKASQDPDTLADHTVDAVNFIVRFIEAAYSLKG